MYTQCTLFSFSLFVILFSSSLSPSSAELGTTSHYQPPYFPTACFGNDVSQLPSDGYFAAAGEEIWKNGTACGEKYLVSCISSIFSEGCKKGVTIPVLIADRAQTSVSRPSKPGCTMVLSQAAIDAIADRSATWVDIQFKQL